MDKDSKFTHEFTPSEITGSLYFNFRVRKYF